MIGGGSVARRSLDFINGKFLVIANNVKPLLYIWPINSSDTIQNFKFVLPAKANSIAISPGSGEFLVAGIKENIYIWHIATGKMVTMLSKHYQQINCVKFIDDGSHFVSAGQDGQAIVWSLSASVGDKYRVENIEPLHTFSDHSLPISDLWIGSGGLAAVLVTVSLDRTCKVYDIASGSMLVSLVFQEIITAVAVNRLETDLFIGTSLGNIYHHRLQPLPRTREYHITDEDKINNKFSGHTKPITCLAISLDEQTLISGSQDCNAITWNIQSRSILKTIPHKGAITNIRLIATPQVMFNREAKFELITKNFERMIKNSDEDEKDTIEIYHLHDIEDEIIYAKRHHQSTMTTSNNSEIDELRAEVEKLKRINKELFDFAAKNTIDN